MSEDRFASAHFYAGEDDERLSHEDPWEYIQEVLDQAGEPGMTLRQVIAEATPITVCACVRMDHGSQRQLGSRLAEWAIDEIEGEYGDPLDCVETTTPEMQKSLAAAFTAAIDRVMRDVKIFACEEVARREYSEADVLEEFASDVAADDAESSRERDRVRAELERYGRG